MLFLLLMLSQLPCCISSTVSEIEITALYNFWIATQGPEWNWRNGSYSISIDGMVWNTTEGQPWNFSFPLTSSEPCLPGTDRWQGVSCSVDNDHITSLMLPTFGLNGSIPSDLCDLYALNLVSLAANFLHGPIPSCISRLSALVILDLKNNTLSDSIPDSLWELTQLKWLNVFNNYLTGTLSTGVGNLPQLRMLALAANLMTGELPSELGRLENVVYAPLGMYIYLFYFCTCVLHV
jgi:hypothetical protein